MTEFTNKTPNLWEGLRPVAQSILSQRNYDHLPLPQKLSSCGIEAHQAIAQKEEILVAGGWIPGVEIFSRNVFAQPHRGVFGELGRMDEGIFATLALPINQWSAARMFAGTSKGFHIHPPYIPEGKTASEWFKYLFEPHTERVNERLYTKEQWDIMYFLQGRVEILLIDERVDLPRRIMRFLIEGDNHRGPNNAGVIIPPGVAHAIHVEGSEDVITVYGTTTSFDRNNEGRIACEVESALLPEAWRNYLSKSSSSN